MVRSMVRRNLEPGTGDSPMKLETNRVADEQPLQAHLRNKSAKEPSAKEAVQPNARCTGIRLWIIKGYDRQ